MAFCTSLLPEVIIFLSWTKTMVSISKVDLAQSGVWKSDEEPEQDRVWFEIGISQSLPDLRRRAYNFCAITNKAWENLRYVGFIKRYTVPRIYVEFWRRNKAATGAPRVGSTLVWHQCAPGELAVSHTMEFVANAHASNTGISRTPTEVLARQFGLPATCDNPAGDDLLAGGAPVNFDAQAMLNKCRFRDLQQWKPLIALHCYSSSWVFRINKSAEGHGSNHQNTVQLWRTCTREIHYQTFVVCLLYC